MTGLLSRLRRSGEESAADETQAQLASLTRRIVALEAAVDENRRLNQRLADVVDVVTEVLVPAVDRDDEKVARALDNLSRTLSGRASEE